MTEKKRFGTLGETHGVISPNFCVKCASWPLNYIPGFIQISSGLGSYNQKLPQPSKVNAI